MTVLGIDSTEKSGSAAITENGVLIGQTVLNTGNTHSETLLLSVEYLLSLCGKTVGDIDLFACSAGPGSFTGVRIGVSVIKGLAFGRGKPVIGVSALESMATDFDGMKGGIVCPCMDARHNQLYNALFRCTGNGIERLVPDRAIDASDLARELESLNETVYFTGGGRDIAANALGNKSLIGFVPEILHFENASGICRLAEKIFAAGGASTDTDLKPIYLRPSQAERAVM